MKIAYGNLLRGYDNSHSSVKGSVLDGRANKKVKNRKSKFPDIKSYVLPLVESSKKQK